MKIAQATVRVLDTLDDTPLIPDLPEPGEHVGPRELIAVELVTDDGLRGLGITYWHGAMAPALRAAVEALGAVVIGEDPFRTEMVAAKAQRAVGRTSANGNGMFHLAFAAIDMACWDIKGKATNRSVAELIGSARDRVDAYASGALLRGFPTERLGATAARLVEMGFHQLKVQCGSERNAAEAVARIRAVRNAVGPDIDVMCDVNQLWGVHQAVELGRQLEPYHLFWIEDPTVSEDHSGLAHIARELTTSVVCGEYLYGVAPFRQLLELRAMDIVMIDVLRVGGITNWLKVAALAEAFNLSVVSHRLPEVDVQLVAAVPNGLTVEYRPLTTGVFEQVPDVDDGQIVVPNRPGLGLTLDADGLRRHQVYAAVA